MGADCWNNEITMRWRELTFEIIQGFETQVHTSELRQLLSLVRAYLHVMLLFSVQFSFSFIFFFKFIFWQYKMTDNWKAEIVTCDCKTACMLLYLVLPASIVNVALGWLQGELKAYRNVMLSPPSLVDDQFQQWSRHRVILFRKVTVKH